jgi:hypothetical protein
MIISSNSGVGNKEYAVTPNPLALSLSKGCLAFF